ncbi:hypothetical protein GGF43_004731, partial [Coemansia sp. RSA 2618]
MAAGERNTWLFLLIAALLTLVQSSHCQYQRLSKRSVSAADISNFRGAILVKNGKPTSCECALIDNKAAFVAVNCLDMAGKRLKDSGTKYEIYFDGAKGNQPGKATIDADNIIIHPKYNPTSYSNNLALVQFSYTDQSSWVNYIAAYRDEWTDVAYVRRILSSASTSAWSSPKVRSYTSSDSACEDASGLYRYNKNVLFCNRIYTASVFSSTCNMPYGSIYGVTSSSMAIAGLYSHSVVYGTGVCGGSVEHHLYIVLTNYLRWAASVLGRKPKEFVEDTDGLESEGRIVSYYMKNAMTLNDDGTYMFGGDMISPIAGKPGPNPPTAAPAPAPAPAPPAPATTPASGSNSNSNTGSNAGSGTNTGSGSNTGSNAGSNSNAGSGSNTTPANTTGSNSGSGTTNTNAAKPSSSTGSSTSQGSQNTNNNGNDDDGNVVDTDNGNANVENNNDDAHLTAVNDDDEFLQDDDDEFLQADDESNSSSSSVHAESASVLQNGKYADPADTSGLYGDSEIDNDLLDTYIDTNGTQDSNRKIKYTGLSTGAVIAMAVAIPVGFILMLIIVFILYKIYRKDKKTQWRKGGSIKRNHNVHSLVDELGGASHNEMLPT